MEYFSENLNPSPTGQPQNLDASILAHAASSLTEGIMNLENNKKIRSEIIPSPFIDSTSIVNPDSTSSNIYKNHESPSEYQKADSELVNQSVESPKKVLEDHAKLLNGACSDSSSPKKSNVLYLRRLPNKIDEANVASLATPFGQIKNMVVTKFSSHALIEMNNEDDAVAMKNYYTNIFPAFIPPVSKSKNPKSQLISSDDFPSALSTLVNDQNRIDVQFSRYQNLTTKVSCTQIQNAIRTANTQSYYIDLYKKRVLRVHIKNCPDTLKLSHIVLYKIFHRFGPILRIIVFKVNTVFPQAFVEFDNYQSAAVAKLVMNAMPLSYRGGFLQVDYSSQETIEIRKYNDLNRDYTKEPLNSNDNYMLDYLDKNFGDLNCPLFGLNSNLVNNLKKMPQKAQLMPTLAQFNGAHSISDSMMGLNDLYAQIFSMQQNLQERLKCGDKISADQARFYVTILAQTLSQALNIQHSQYPSQKNMNNKPSGNKPDSNQFFKSANSYKDPTQLFQNGSNIQSKVRKDELLMPVSNIQLPNDVGYGFKTLFVPVNASPVIIVSHLESNRITPDILFTLFGVYGDVIRVKIMYSKRDTALIQFADSFQAAVAIENLNGQILYGKKILCNTSKYYQIKLPSQAILSKVSKTQADNTTDPQTRYEEGKSRERQNEEDNFEEADDGHNQPNSDDENLQLAMSLTKDYFDSPLHRYKKANSRNFANIYAPSCVLHISNLPGNILIEDLEKIFNENGHKVIKSRLMLSERKMALLQFATVELAMIALIEMHNYPISEENRIRVCFSRSQIVPPKSSTFNQQNKRSSVNNLEEVSSNSDIKMVEENSPDVPSASSKIIENGTSEEANSNNWKIY